MFGQSIRSQKAPTVLGGSASGVNTSEFHTVRGRETERTRLITDLGAREDRNQVAPSYFVPSLQALCADNLAANFITTPEIDALQGEDSELYEMIVERLPVAVLPTEEAKWAGAAAAAANQAAKTPTPVEASASSSTFLPLNVAVPRVMGEAYWKRCCLARWSAGQLSKFTGGGKPLLEKQYGWKRLFLEQMLNSFLMSLRSGSPSGDEGGHLQPTKRPVGGGQSGNPQGRTHTLGAPSFLFSSSGGRGGETGDGDAQRLDGGFHPSQLSEEDARALSELCAMCRDYVHTVELPCQYTHLDWYDHLFSKLPGILSFRLSYGTVSVGIGYDKAMLGFTDQDAESIRFLLSRYTSLEALRLPQNSLNSPRVMMMSAGLVGNTRLRVLDLSRNAIDDTAITEGVALLLCQPEFPLEELNLNDNKITSVGAKALAEALAVNHTLTVLNVGQNRIGDADGGAELVRALGQNPQSPLRELRVDCNLLAGETVAALRDVLPELHTLAALNLAGNRHISAEVGDALCEAVLGNDSLHFIDVRFCGLSPEQVSKIESAVQGRVEHVADEERSAKEEEQRNRIAVIVNSRPSGRF